MTEDEKLVQAVAKVSARIDKVGHDQVAVRTRLDDAEAALQRILSEAPGGPMSSLADLSAAYEEAKDGLKHAAIEAHKALANLESSLAEAESNTEPEGR